MKPVGAPWLRSSHFSKVSLASFFELLENQSSPAFHGFLSCHGLGGGGGGRGQAVVCFQVFFTSCAFSHVPFLCCLPSHSLSMFWSVTCLSSRSAAEAV